MPPGCKQRLPGMSRWEGVRVPLGSRCRLPPPLWFTALLVARRHPRPHACPGLHVGVVFCLIEHVLLIAVCEAWGHLGG